MIDIENTLLELDFDINDLDDLLSTLKGFHGEGWINISMRERRLFAILLEHFIDQVDNY